MLGERLSLHADSPWRGTWWSPWLLVSLSVSVSWVLVFLLVTRMAAQASGGLECRPVVLLLHLSVSHGLPPSGVFGWGELETPLLSLWKCQPCWSEGLGSGILTFGFCHPDVGVLFACPILRPSAPPPALWRPLWAAPASTPVCGLHFLPCWFPLFRCSGFFIVIPS